MSDDFHQFWHRVNTVTDRQHIVEALAEKESTRDYIFAHLPYLTNPYVISRLALIYECFVPRLKHFPQAEINRIAAAILQDVDLSLAANADILHALKSLPSLPIVTIATNYESYYPDFAFGPLLRRNLSLFRDAAAAAKVKTYRNALAVYDFWRIFVEPSDEDVWHALLKDDWEQLLQRTSNVLWFRLFGEQHPFDFIGSAEGLKRRLRELGIPVSPIYNVGRECEVTDMYDLMKKLPTISLKDQDRALRVYETITAAGGLDVQDHRNLVQLRGRPIPTIDLENRVDATEAEYYKYAPRVQNDTTYMFRGISVDHLQDIRYAMNTVTFVTSKFLLASGYAQRDKRKFAVVFIIKCFPGMPIIGTESPGVFLLPRNTVLTPSSSNRPCMVNAIFYRSVLTIQCTLSPEESKAESLK